MQVQLHHASIWEAVADCIGDCDAVVQGDRRLSWSVYENRAARLAAVFADAGLKTDSKVATFLYNCPELLEARFAALKQRAVPVNVNYRYVDEELVYVVENSDSEAVVFHSSLGDRVGRVRGLLPKVRLWIEVDDDGRHLSGALRYEDTLAAATPAPRIDRSPDDVQMIYTGGTTGKPKGVIIGIGNSTTAGLGLAAQMGMPTVAPPDAPAVAKRLAGEGTLPRAFVPCPLMHGTGIQLGSNPFMLLGGCTVLLPSRKFDPVELWEVAVQERATVMTLVGDAMAKPLLQALQSDLTISAPALKFIASSGAMFARETKAGLVNRLPDLTIFDLMSSTEGSLGKALHTQSSSVGTSSFQLNPLARVFDDDDREVKPGSGSTGRIAVTGNIPLGYYKDPEKSAATFRMIDGKRWSFPGDYATVETDGSITLLGRGSSVINTGGEKVFAEEVEESIKRHPGVNDCLVVGLADPRFGQVVVALVSGQSLSEDGIRATVRSQLASYKIPKVVVFVDHVPRGPNGKADYALARGIAQAAHSPEN